MPGGRDIIIPRSGILGKLGWPANALLTDVTVAQDWEVFCRSFPPGRAPCNSQSCPVPNPLEWQDAKERCQKGNDALTVAADAEPALLRTTLNARLDCVAPDG
jgi:hypothetical protein